MIIVAKVLNFSSDGHWQGSKPQQCKPTNYLIDYPCLRCLKYNQCNDFFCRIEIMDCKYNIVHHRENVVS